MDRRRRSRDPRPADAQPPAGRHRAGRRAVLADGAAHQATVEACHAATRDDFSSLPDLLASFRDRGWDVVEMVLAGQDDWDRYVAAHWLNIRTWLDATPDDELAPRLRTELDTEPVSYARYQREYLGWGVYALMRR